jgi:hypothetical protein
MTRDSGMCTDNQKWIKMRMKTSICLNNKGNEVIVWRSFDVGSCILLNNHHRYMCCHCQCSLHHICANQINNDNVHQSMEAIVHNKNIHSSLGVVREKVGNLPLNMCSTLQNNSCNNIPKCVMGYFTLTPTRASKQMDT